MGGFSAWHWVIVIAVFVLLFGAKKLPDAARSLGKSMRIFKSEIKEMQSERIEPPAEGSGGIQANEPKEIAPEIENPPGRRPA